MDQSQQQDSSEEIIYIAELTTSVDSSLANAASTFAEEVAKRWDVKVDIPENGDMGAFINSIPNISNQERFALLADYYQLEVYQYADQAYRYAEIADTKGNSHAAAAWRDAARLAEELAAARDSQSAAAWCKPPRGSGLDYVWHQ